MRATASRRCGARSKGLKGTYAIPVPYEDHLYGFSGRFLTTCVDAASGETVWKYRAPGGGDLVLVDGHLVIQAPNGEVVIAEATPEGYREKARIAALDKGYLTRPSFASGRVYVRNLSDVAAVGIREQAPEEPGTEAMVADLLELEGEFGKAIGKLLATDEKDRAAMVDKLLADHNKLPILEDDLVHFVYRGEVDDLALASNFDHSGSEQPLFHVAGTDLWFKSVRLPAASHFQYNFAVFDEPMPDPANPHKVGAEGQEQSVLTTPGWQEPAFLAEPEGARGEIVKYQWTSEILGNDREVQIYLPPGYGEGKGRYPLLVVNHGDQALSLGHMGRALDNLVGESASLP